MPIIYCWRQLEHYWSGLMMGFCGDNESWDESWSQNISLVWCNKIYVVKMSCVFQTQTISIFFPFWFCIHKVNRCLARYSPRATTTNQPTNSVPNEPDNKEICRLLQWGIKSPHRVMKFLTLLKWEKSHNHGTFPTILTATRWIWQEETHLSPFLREWPRVLPKMKMASYSRGWWKKVAASVKKSLSD